MENICYTRGMGGSTCDGMYCSWNVLHRVICIIAAGIGRGREVVGAENTATRVAGGGRKALGTLDLHLLPHTRTPPSSLPSAPGLGPPSITVIFIQHLVCRSNFLSAIFTNP